MGCTVVRKGILPTSAKRSPKKSLHIGPYLPNSKTPKPKHVSWSKGFSNDFCWRGGTRQSVERSPKFCRNHFTRTIRGCCEWTYGWAASILGGSPERRTKRSPKKTSRMPVQISKRSGDKDLPQNTLNSWGKSWLTTHLSTTRPAIPACGTGKRAEDTRAVRTAKP
jgi:hypothetical protein